MIVSDDSVSSAKEDLDGAEAWLWGFSPAFFDVELRFALICSNRDETDGASGSTFLAIVGFVAEFSPFVLALTASTLPVTCIDCLSFREIDAADEATRRGFRTVESEALRADISSSAICLSSVCFRAVTLATVGLANDLRLERDLAREESRWARELGFWLLTARGFTVCFETTTLLAGVSTRDALLFLSTSIGFGSGALTPTGTWYSSISIRVTVNSDGVCRSGAVSLLRFRGF